MVKYQSDAGGRDASDPAEKRSGLAIERFFETSIPLMLVTFAIAAAWYRYEKKRRNAQKKQEENEKLWV
jgi:hypothetical protein